MVKKLWDAVGTHLINRARAGTLELYYWRQQNDEVDFVLKYQGKVMGLEVKSRPPSGGATQKASGMQAFQKQLHPDRVLLVGKDSLPWQDFLQIDPVALF